MPVEIKKTKIKIVGPAMTNRRFSQYSTFKVDGAVVSTQTDNTTPTSAQMEAIVKGLYRYERLCQSLSSVGMSVTMLTDTSTITTVPTTIDLEISYNPNYLADASAVLSAGITATLASTPVATQQELIQIANLVNDALNKPVDASSVQIKQSWNGPAIEVIKQLNAEDNNVAKAYACVQLTTKEYVLDGHVASITVTEF